jgi:hypothetical protein
MKLTFRVALKMFNHDDALLKNVSPVLDSLYRAYTSSEHEGSAK